MRSGLQAIAQVDRLVAYGREAFAMYQELTNGIRADIVKTIMTLQVKKAPTRYSVPSCSLSSSVLDGTRR